MTLIERIKAPTPAFFKKIRNVAIAVAAVGSAILASPVALPALLVKIAGYLVVAGAVGTTISQTTGGEMQQEG